MYFGVEKKLDNSEVAKVTRFINSYYSNNGINRIAIPYFIMKKEFIKKWRVKGSTEIGLPLVNGEFKDEIIYDFTLDETGYPYNYELEVQSFFMHRVSNEKRHSHEKLKRVWRKVEEGMYNVHEHDSSNQGVDNIINKGVNIDNPKPLVKVDYLPRKKREQEWDINPVEFAQVLREIADNLDPKMESNYLERGKLKKSESYLETLAEYETAISLNLNSTRLLYLPTHYRDLDVNDALCDTYGKVCRDINKLKKNPEATKADEVNMNGADIIAISAKGNRNLEDLHVCYEIIDVKSQLEAHKIRNKHPSPYFDYEAFLTYPNKTVKSDTDKTLINNVKQTHFAYVNNGAAHVISVKDIINKINMDMKKHGYTRNKDAIGKLFFSVYDNPQKHCYRIEWNGTSLHDSDSHVFSSSYMDNIARHYDVLLQVYKGKKNKLSFIRDCVQQPENTQRITLGDDSDPKHTEVLEAPF